MPWRYSLDFLFFTLGKLKLLKNLKHDSVNRIKLYINYKIRSCDVGLFAKRNFYYEQCLYLLDPKTVSISCQTALGPIIFFFLQIMSEEKLISLIKNEFKLLQVTTEPSQSYI